MRLERMSCEAAKSYFAKDDTVIFAIGSIENHGSHNVLGVDYIIPTHLLDLIEKQSDVLIAPPIPYGACDTLADFPGTVSLGQDVLCMVINKIVEGLYNHGARRFLFLNGHGGNIGALDRVGAEWHKRGVLCAQINWWLMVWDMNPAWKGGHGGAEETSAMLAIDPSLVDRSNIREMELKNDLGDELQTAGFKSVKYKGVEIPVNRAVINFTGNGWIGPDHPSKATEEWGREMLQAAADYVADFIEAFKRVELSKG